MGKNGENGQHNQPLNAISQSVLLGHAGCNWVVGLGVENLQRFFSCRNIIRSNGLRHGAKAMLNFSVCEHANRRPNLHEARRCGEKTSPEPLCWVGLVHFDTRQAWPRF